MTGFALLEDFPVFLHATQDDRKKLGEATWRPRCASGC
jgi:hypothetical protein